MFPWIKGYGNTHDLESFKFLKIIRFTFYMITNYIKEINTISNFGEKDK